MLHKQKLLICRKSLTSFMWIWSCKRTFSYINGKGMLLYLLYIRNASKNALQSNLLVALIWLTIASIIILFAIWVISGFLNRMRWHKDCASSPVISSPGICDKLRKRSLHASTKIGQYRRKGSLSSLAIPHRQTGSIQLKLCLNLCSFSPLNFSRNFDKCLTPTISPIP